jgi:uncharacterized protein (TIGR02001 family)
MPSELINNKKYAEGDPHMWKPRVEFLLIGLGLLGVAATAQAESSIKGLTANASVTTNYVFRGQTQTDDSPAIQGGIDYNHPSGFYAGAWGSNVDFPGLGSGLEYDLYAGFKFTVAPEFKLNVGYITYNYTDSTVDDVIGTNEVFLGGEYKDFAAYYYNGNGSGNNDYQYFDLRYSLKGLPQDIKLTLHYGHLDPKNAGNVDDASVRVSKVISGFEGALTLTTVDSSNNNNNDKTRLFLSVTKYFDL